MHTAKAGCLGSFAPQVFYFSKRILPKKCKLFSFFTESGGLALETRKKIVYNSRVYVLPRQHCYHKETRGIDYMSASDKKRLRKEQKAALLTEKQVAQQKEAKKLKIYSITFIVVMILVACIAIGTIVYTSLGKTGIFQKTTIAATVNNHELTAAELGFFYMDAINYAHNQWQETYGEYTDSMLKMMGLDLSASLGSQIYNAETGDTWADYFIEAAIENARTTYAVYDTAMADENYTLSEEAKTNMEEENALMPEYAELFYGGDVDGYIEALYGAGADFEGFKAYNEVVTTVTDYQNTYYDALTYDDATVSAFETEHYNDYNSYTFVSKFLDHTDFLGEGLKDENGNVTHTEAETKAALDAAKATAETLASAKTAEEFDRLIAALDIYSDNKEEAVSEKITNALLPTVYEDLQDWLAADGRKEGDTTVIPYIQETTAEDGTVTSKTTGYFAVFFQNSTENREPLANVRHLLVAFEGGTADSSGNKTYTAEEKDAAKKAAEDLLKTWKDGKATEESFIELVKEHTDDTGSAESGGLFEDISPASSLVEPFLNWCIDPAREAGDVDIVESEFGYHIMYYVGDDEVTYRQTLIDADMKNQDFEKWITAIEETGKAEAGNTRFMHKNIIIANSSAY